MANNKLEMTEVASKHLDLTYCWAVDERIRKYSFEKNNITRKSHELWFYEKLNSDDCYYYILYLNDTPVGSFRIDLDKFGIGLISFLLSPEFHGKGLGRSLLKAGLEKANDLEHIIGLRGEVLNVNIASIKIFESLGFEIESKNERKTTFIKYANGN